MKPTVSVVLPTYNERSNIKPLIRAIQKELVHVSHEIIVVDDNSPDGTARVVASIARTSPTVICVRRIKGPRGLSDSIKEGLQRCQGRIIIGMDADFNHDPAILPELIKKLRQSDLVVASRFVTAGGMDDTWRYYTSWLFNLFLKYGLGFPILDNTSGFYAIRRRTLLRLGLDQIYQGYGEYHLRLVYFVHRSGGRLTEIPVWYRERVAGQSKSRLIEMGIVYLWTAIKLRFSH